MLSNLHTHTTYCDGKNTPEEIVLSAMDRGFTSIGFSGHGYTPFDLRYCMKDTDGYIREITALKEKYKDKIKIYLGIEEDAFAPCDRTRFDYIIGSSHYLRVDGKYLPIDSSREHFAKCLEAFGDDTLSLADSYYSAFCDYIARRRPDVVGHFDVITKYDEKDGMRFLGDRNYLALAKKYIRGISGMDVIFEVNTGAISRAYRTSPYPHIELLYEIKRADGKVTLSSDSHNADTLDFYFDRAKMMLRDAGFDGVYVFDGGKFVKERF